MEVGLELRNYLYNENNPKIFISSEKRPKKILLKNVVLKRSRPGGIF